MEHKNKPPEWYSHNVPPEHHHPHNEWLVDRCSDQCDDQLPLFSRVGRGLQGNGYKVEVEQASDCETYLHGYIYDSATGTYISDWQSHNVNGGHLSYQYNLHPYGDPPTFTITFKYDRPCYDDEHDMSWEWTTPAIPYILDAGGSGIGNLFVKPTTGATWTAVRNAVASSDLPDSIADTLAAYEKLVFPEDETRDALQPPLPGDDWTVNLTYGKGGDIDCPTTDQEQADLDDLEQHFHDDLGYGDDGAWPEGLKGDGESGNRNTVWKWIKWITDKLGFGTTYNIGDNTVKKYIDDSIPSVKAGTGISVNKSGTEYTVSHNLAGSSNVTLTPGQNGQLIISATDTNTVTTVTSGDNVISVVEGGSGSNKTYTITADLSSVEGDVIEKIIAPTMKSVTIPGRLFFNQLSYATKGTLMITNSWTCNLSRSVLAHATVYCFDTMPEVVISIDIDEPDGNGNNDYLMEPSFVGVFCVFENNSWKPLNFGGTHSYQNWTVLSAPKVSAETLCNCGWLTDHNYQLYCGVGNIKASRKNDPAFNSLPDTGTPIDSNKFGGWPWASGSDSAFYLYIINRYVRIGDETGAVTIDYARDYHTDYLRTKMV